MGLKVTKGGGDVSEILELVEDAVRTRGNHYGKDWKVWPDIFEVTKPLDWCSLLRIHIGYTLLKNSKYWCILVRIHRRHTTLALNRKSLYNIK